MEKPNRVTLNVSGEMFETLEQTLSRFPETLLGDSATRQRYYCSLTNQYFFNRNRLCFGAILYFYQSHGILSCPLDIPIDIFEDECQFFKIPEENICEMKLKDVVSFVKKSDASDKSFSNKKLKDKFWNLLEKPDSSYWAKCVAIFSFLMIIISVLTTCMETLPQYLAASPNLLENPWNLLEFSLNIWFLFELLARFFTTPSKLFFVRSLMNWLDALAICPYFVLIALSRDNVRSLSFLRILKMIRVIRLFRFSKHSKRLEFVGEIIKSSMAELQLLFLCLTILVVFGGSIMYYIEGFGENSQFTSIPEGLWWAVQTVVTLGYGDITPATLVGKITASLFMAFGALTLSVPVLSIVIKFIRMYSQSF